MSIIASKIIETPSASDDLTVRTGNTSGPSIVISSANNNIYVNGDLVGLDNYFKSDINAQTGTSYTIQLTDSNQTITMNNAANNTLTIPSNDTAAIPIGSIIPVIMLGEGLTIIAADDDVTLNGKTGGFGNITAQYQTIWLRKLSTNTWVASGDMSAILATSTYLAIAHSGTPYITVYPWTSSGFGTKFSDPASLPTSDAASVVFTTNTDAIIVGHSGSPYITAYPWTSSGFGTKFSDPASLPDDYVTALDFSPDGNAVAIGQQSLLFGNSVSAYAWSGSGFGAKFSDAAGPNSNCWDIKYSPDGESIAMVSENSPRIHAYAWSGSGFGAKFSNPGELPANIGRSVAFSPDGTAIAVGHSGGENISAYAWSGSGFGAKFSDPGTSPASAGYDVAFSPDGVSLAVAHITTPFVTAYAWSGSGFGAKFSDPGTLPGGAGLACEFSPDGTAIIVGHATSPFVTAYAWSGSGFGAKFSDPGTLPGGTAQMINFGEITE